MDIVNTIVILPKQNNHNTLFSVTRLPFLTHTNTVLQKKSYKNTFLILNYVDFDLSMTELEAEPACDCEFVAPALAAAFAWAAALAFELAAALD